MPLYSLFLSSFIVYFSNFPLNNYLYETVSLLFAFYYALPLLFFFFLHCPLIVYFFLSFLNTPFYDNALDIFFDCVPFIFWHCLINCSFIALPLFFLFITLPLYFPFSTRTFFFFPWQWPLNFYLCFDIVALIFFKALFLYLSFI